MKNHGTFKKHQRLLVVLLLVILVLGAVACSQETNNQSEELQIIEAYINGFYEFYNQGNEYNELGLQLQADYAYGWAAASLSSLRYAIDCILYLKGEGNTLEDVVGNRLDDWDEIAAMNYVSPYPYYFEALIYNVQDKNEDAQMYYEKALINPAFSSQNDESLSVLQVLSINELKSLKDKLIDLEDEIYEAYQAEKLYYPRSEFNFSDKYLRTQAKEVLEMDETDYGGALRHYEVALLVNPFEGDNFVGCALMNLYMDDFDKAYFYINEGLFVDPDHEGLNNLADFLNEEVPQL